MVFFTYQNNLKSLDVSNNSRNLDSSYKIDFDFWITWTYIFVMFLKMEEKILSNNWVTSGDGKPCHIDE